MLELSQPADPLFKGKRFYSPAVFTVSKSSFINENCQLCVCVSASRKGLLEST